MKGIAQNGTAYHEATLGLETLTLSKTIDLEGGSSGRKDMGFKGIWQTVL